MRNMLLPPSILSILLPRGPKATPTKILSANVAITILVLIHVITVPRFLAEEVVGFVAIIKKGLGRATLCTQVKGAKLA